jgi:2,4-dienoyl-CoA reductase-like NADH-dependent reductase (Old Yellow Enzyme family)
MSHAKAPGTDASVLSEVDRLFATMDGVRVSSELGEWSSRIQGIHADGPYVWVQLSHDDQDTQSVVLRLPRQTTVAEIIRAFGSVRFDEESSSVIRK